MQDSTLIRLNYIEDENPFICPSSSVMSDEFKSTKVYDDYKYNNAFLYIYNKNLVGTAKNQNDLGEWKKEYPERSRIYVFDKTEAPVSPLYQIEKPATTMLISDGVSNIDFAKSEQPLHGSGRSKAYITSASHGEGTIGVTGYVDGSTGSDLVYKAGQLEDYQDHFFWGITPSD
jgi:hypothetical protein